MTGAGAKCVGCRDVVAGWRFPGRADALRRSPGAHRSCTFCKLYLDKATSSKKGPRTAGAQVHLSVFTANTARKREGRLPAPPAAGRPPACAPDSRVPQGTFRVGPTTGLPSQQTNERVCYIMRPAGRRGRPPCRPGYGPALAPVPPRRARGGRAYTARARGGPRAGRGPTGRRLRGLRAPFSSFSYSEND